MLHTYPQNILDTFQAAIRGNKKAFRTLMDEKYPELAAFSNAIKGDENAEMWLKARGRGDWWLIFRALNNDKIAFKQLQEKEDKFTISFVLACQDRIEGKYWLTKNEYTQFLPICEAVVSMVDTANREGAWGWLYNGSVRKLH